MTKIEHDKRMMVVRVYTRPDGKKQRVHSFIKNAADAKATFRFLCRDETTLYACVFSPVDKNGRRRQLPRHVYNVKKWQAAQERVANVYAQAMERAASLFLRGD